MSAPRKVLKPSTIVRIASTYLIGLAGFMLMIPAIITGNLVINFHPLYTPMIITPRMAITGTAYEITPQLAGVVIKNYDAYADIPDFDSTMQAAGVPVNIGVTRFELPTQSMYEKQASGELEDSLGKEDYLWTIGTLSYYSISDFSATIDDTPGMLFPKIAAEISQVQPCSKDGVVGAQTSEKFEYTTQDGTKVVLMKSYYIMTVSVHTEGTVRGNTEKYGDNIIQAEGSGENDQGTYTGLNDANLRMDIQVIIKVSMQPFQYDDLLDEGFSWVVAGVAGGTLISQRANLDLTEVRLDQDDRDQRGGWYETAKAALVRSAAVERYEHLWEALKGITALPPEDENATMDLSTELPSTVYIPFNFMLQPGTVVKYETLSYSDDYAVHVLNVQATTDVILTAWSLWVAGSERDILSSDSTFDLMNLTHYETTETGNSFTAGDVGAALDPTSFLNDLLNMKIGGLTLMEWLVIGGLLLGGLFIFMFFTTTILPVFMMLTPKKR